MLTCFDVANYFLNLQDEEIGDIITHLKLQKLVYYAQGFHIAETGNPLFNENIEAWEHGPVCPSLYQKYKDKSSNPIPIPKDYNESIYNEDQKDLLDDINHVYGQFSAWKLRNLTHDEPPWLKTPDKEIITHKLMESYFKTQLID